MVWQHQIQLEWKIEKQINPKTVDSKLMIPNFATFEAKLYQSRQHFFTKLLCFRARMCQYHELRISQQERINSRDSVDGSCIKAEQFQ